jgi:hypothetical protein
MSGPSSRALSLGVTALALAIASHVPTSGQAEHPPTLDRVARLNQALIAHRQTLGRDGRTGYLRSVLDALGVPVDSQLLVFSKTGAQRAYTSPRTPRALYFDESVAVGYVPGAPMIELAAHDAQHGMVFYSLDQTAAAPSIVRQTGCLTCHVSPSTLGVPGMIARSHHVADDGSVLPAAPVHDVTHQTPHPDRWGGWFVTFEDAPPAYSQLAHAGNITFSPRGDTSNQVFVDWINSAPGERGYLSASSDIAALLVFDHQVHALNLLTKLNQEARLAPYGVAGLVDALADYLLFVGEEPPIVALRAPTGLADRLASKTPKDRRGRSFAQFDLVRRLMRYPCSYVVYSDVFDDLPQAVRHAVYRRMIDRLSGNETALPRVSLDDRQAILEILRDTKPDFPQK